MAEALAQRGIKLAQGDGDGAACDPPLEISAKNMKVNMENFSRTLDKSYYGKAMTIAGKLG